MSRKKNQKTLASSWRSADPYSKEKRHIQTGNSFLLFETVQSLGYGSRILLDCMAMESAGEECFKFTKGTAKKYGFPVASFSRFKEELLDKDFILITHNGWDEREPNEYKFSVAWKSNDTHSTETRRYRLASPWRSAYLDCMEGRYIQTGYSFLRSKAVQSLGYGARVLLDCMAMESAGRQLFQFTKSAAKKYGFPISSFNRYKQELVSNSFIEITQSGWNTREPNEYKFLISWKSKGAQFGKAKVQTAVSN